MYRRSHESYGHFPAHNNVPQQYCSSFQYHREASRSLQGELHLSFIKILRKITNCRVKIFTICLKYQVRIYIAFFMPLSRIRVTRLET